MDEQLKKILESIKELEKQIHALEAMPEKNPHIQSLTQHATQTLLPGLRAFVYQSQNIQTRSAADIAAENQGLLDLARYEAFSMFYDDRPTP